MAKDQQCTEQKSRLPHLEERQDEEGARARPREGQPEIVAVEEEPREESKRQTRPLVEEPAPNRLPNRSVPNCWTTSDGTTPRKHSHIPRSVDRLVELANLLLRHAEQLTERLLALLGDLGAVM